MVVLHHKRLMSVAMAILVALIMVPATVMAQDSVEDILDAGASKVNDRVTVEGTITQYIRGDGENTAHYLLKGAYGGIIRVNSGSGEPDINERDRVTGVVYQDSNGRSVFISEQSRTKLDGAATNDRSSSSSTIIVVLIVAAVGIIAYLLLRQSRQSTAAASPLNFAPKDSKPNSASVDSGPATTMQPFGELATIRMTKPPKTVKFIPGTLEVLSGKDAGKTLRLCGYPDGNGSVVTIGRERVAGERAYAHLQLSDQYPTVSRKQAEFRYRNGTLYVKNLSRTNPTQLDGNELLPGEERELRSGSTLSMGELQLTYTS